MSAGVSALLGRCCKSTVALPLDTLSFDVRALSRNDAGGKAAQRMGREARLRVASAECDATLAVVRAAATGVSERGAGTQRSGPALVTPFAAQNQSSASRSELSLCL
jgi:hypothetical protein